MVFLFLIDDSYFSFFFFFNDTATTEIYTLSLHDALPISLDLVRHHRRRRLAHGTLPGIALSEILQDRKSTRLNSSHDQISYAVFCLKKKMSSAMCPRRAILPSRHMPTRVTSRNPGTASRR